MCIRDRYMGILESKQTLSTQIDSLNVEIESLKKKATEYIQQQEAAETMIIKLKETNIQLEIEVNQIKEENQIAIEEEQKKHQEDVEVAKYQAQMETAMKISKENQITMMNLQQEKNALQQTNTELREQIEGYDICLLYTSPSPRDLSTSRMPSSA
eukprot:TRINITY_DN13966_c0_g1_i2.p2 TRINITY_DN13966_c0_g1~~TRINITY_DN13966_c0_g1_i2.p2  ORF type:complete len:164 (+),score=51.62 TRINITY_DN13966_c0_g1_i2:26-493(+)